MEEKGESSVDSKLLVTKDRKVAEELKNIDKIERSIVELQSHIKFLLKKENQQNKKITQLYDASIEKAVSKISFASALAQNQEQKKKKIQDTWRLSSRVKQNRQKEINMMKQTRMEINKLREVQRSEVREISMRNKERIIQMKEQQRKSNFKKASENKSKHVEIIEQRRIQQEKQKKEKEHQILKKNLMKISEKQKLELEIQKLKKQEEEITTRLEKKKQIKEKLNDITKKITTMPNNEIMMKTRNFQNQGLLTPQYTLQNNQDIENSLIKSAVRKIGSKEKDSIVFLR